MLIIVDVGSSFLWNVSQPFPVMTPGFVVGFRTLDKDFAVCALQKKCLRSLEKKSTVDQLHTLCAFVICAVKAIVGFECLMISNS